LLFIAEMMQEKRNEDLGTFSGVAKLVKKPKSPRTSCWEVHGCCTLRGCASLPQGSDPVPDPTMAQNSRGGWLNPEGGGKVPPHSGSEGSS